MRHTIIVSLHIGYYVWNS